MKIVALSFGLADATNKDLRCSGIEETFILIEKTSEGRGFEVRINLFWTKLKFTRAYLLVHKLQGVIDVEIWIRVTYYCVYEKAIRYQRILKEEGIEVTIDDKTGYVKRTRNRK